MQKGGSCPRHTLTLTIRWRLCLLSVLLFFYASTYEAGRQRDRLFLSCFMSKMPSTVGHTGTPLLAPSPATSHRACLREAEIKSRVRTPTHTFLSGLQACQACLYWCDGHWCSFPWRQSYLHGFSINSRKRNC